MTGAEDDPALRRREELARADTSALLGRQVLLDALALLRSELPAAHGWENDELGAFLEAFEALLGDVEHVYLNEGRPVPDDPWLLVADALRGARHYE